MLIGDSTMFLAGRIFGYRIQCIRTFRRILSPRRFSQIQRKFKKYGLSLLFVARFLPGLRSPIFLVAGMSRRIPYHTFILMDGFAAIISVPIWVYLGYFFADNLDLLMEYVHDVQKLIYLILALIVIVVLVVYLKKRFHHKLKSFTEDHHEAETETTTTALSTNESNSTDKTLTSSTTSAANKATTETTVSTNASTASITSTASTASPDTVAAKESAEPDSKKPASKE